MITTKHATHTVNLRVVRCNCGTNIFHRMLDKDLNTTSTIINEFADIRIIPATGKPFRPERKALGNLDKLIAITGENTIEGQCRKCLKWHTFTQDDLNTLIHTIAR